MGCRETALFIMGLPGAGKTILAKELVIKSGFTLISGGFLLRRLAQGDKDDEDAKTARKIISGGSGAPDEFILRLFRQELENKPFGSIVFDGNLNRTRQLVKLVGMLRHFGFSDGKIAGVWLDVSENVVRKRLKIRRICSSCGVSHEDNSKICRICRSPLIQRLDDTQSEIIGAKITRFTNDVMLIIRFLDKNYRLLHISGEISKKLVFQRVLSWLKAFP